MFLSEWPFLLGSQWKQTSLHNCNRFDFCGCRQYQLLCDKGFSFLRSPNCQGGCPDCIYRNRLFKTVLRFLLWSTWLTKPCNSYDCLGWLHHCAGEAKNTAPSKRRHQESDPRRYWQKHGSYCFRNRRYLDKSIHCRRNHRIYQIKSTWRNIHKNADQRLCRGRIYTYKKRF